MTISYSPGTKTNYSVMALSMMSPNFFLSLFLIIFILGKENRKMQKSESGQIKIIWMKPLFLIV